MKGYSLLILLTAALLLLLPLAAFSHSTATVTQPDDSQPPQTDDSIPDEQSSADEHVAIDAEFRLLCGDRVETLEERDFLIRTLAMEMSPTYHTEALKAQAVAAYTYYARRRQQQEQEADPALLGAHFATPNAEFPAAYTEEALRQRWGDQYEHYYQKICDAVDAVRGQTITYQDTLIDACYHAISAGCTESARTVWGADIPYLQAVASPGDRLAPTYELTCTFTVEEMRQALTAAQPTPTLGDDPAAWFGEPTLSEAGYVASIPVGDAALPGTQVRKALGLRSAAFSVTYREGNFTVITSGYGHGVGLSQYGADYLARQGYSYKEILEYYYTDVTLH